MKAARAKAQLALDQLELLLESRDHGDDHVDLRTQVLIEFERSDAAVVARRQA